jgi:hypothetical protein
MDKLEIKGVAENAEATAGLETDEEAKATAPGLETEAEAKAPAGAPDEEAKEAATGQDMAELDVKEETKAPIVADDQEANTALDGQAMVEPVPKDDAESRRAVPEDEEAEEACKSKVVPNAATSKDGNASGANDAEAKRPGDDFRARRKSGRLERRQSGRMSTSSLPGPEAEGTPGQVDASKAPEYLLRDVEVENPGACRWLICCLGYGRPR